MEHFRSILNKSVIETRSLKVSELEVQPGHRDVILICARALGLACRGEREPMEASRAFHTHPPKYSSQGHVLSPLFLELTTHHPAARILWRFLCTASKGTILDPSIHRTLAEQRNELAHKEGESQGLCRPAHT